MVRPAHRRSEKYKRGISPELTKRKLEAVKPIMVDLETPYLAQITEVERKVKRICETAAVSSYEIAQYINYARQLYSKHKRFEGPTLTNEAQYLTDHWISRGLSCPILIDVAELFGLTVTCEAAIENFLPLIYNLHAQPSESAIAPHWISSLAVTHVENAVYNVYDNMVELQYFPLIRKCRFDRIGLFLAMGDNSPNPNARAIVLFYDDTGNLYPRNLLQQSAQLDVSTIGVKQTVIDLTLEKGIYWIGYITNDNQWNLRYSSWGLRPIGDTTIWYQTPRWWIDQAWPNIPNPFPNGADVDDWYLSVGLHLSEVLE